jgi:tetratricopeptide (TPR) repeat protein
LAGAQPLAAQLPSADALYAAGALRAAADSFAARVDREPSVAAHWYNLGATLYRAGADGKAIAAWTRAARLAPRDPVIRRARRLLPPPDAASDPLLAVGRATPAEWGLAAGLAWVVCWLLVLRRQRLWGVVFGALVLAATVPALFEFRRRHRPVAVVLQPGTVVREAPYGSASPRVTLEGGAAVLVGKTYGAWVEVRRHDGIHGWLLRGDVSRL